MKEVFTELHRMNITEGTLFPNLPGFSEGLKHRLALADFYKGVDLISTSIWEPAFFSEHET